MKISVFGLGYVGCVSASCFAQEGHEVIGVDISQAKVDMINSGKSPIVENGLEEILAKVVKEAKTLLATTDSVKAVQESEISLICVGTPSNENGSLRLDFVRNCAREIGLGLKGKDTYHVVVARSTMLPGSVEEAIIREIEYSSGKKAGRDFGIVINPEFLRESTSIYDFYNPPMTVIGELDSKSGDAVEAMYHFLDAPCVRTEIRVAELIKYACNCFHALKVTYANEIGLISKSIGIDSHEVMKIFCMDKKLNLSSYYLRPAFAFGGSCLPKDLRALNYKARELDIDVPVLRAIAGSNRAHIDGAIQKILKTGKRKIGILGLSFKAGTDDLRESPLVILTEALIGKGCHVLIYDKNVSIAKVVGANKKYIEEEIPHISSLMVEKIDRIFEHSEVIVIGNKSDEFNKILAKSGEEKIIFDLVRVAENINELPHGYEGICW